MNIHLSSAQNLKELDLTERSSPFYILIDMRDIHIEGASTPILKILKMAKKLIKFCKHEAKDERLIAVIIIVKDGDDEIRKIASMLVSMNKSICPSLVCVDIEEGREFARDTAFLKGK